MRLTRTSSAIDKLAQTSAYHPEFSVQRVETSRFVWDVLAHLEGFDISQPAGNSIVAMLGFGRPGPVITLRADMDALPT